MDTAPITASSTMKTLNLLATYVAWTRVEISNRGTNLGVQSFCLQNIGYGDNVNKDGYI